MASGYTVRHMSSEKAEFDPSVSGRHCPVGGVSVALLAMVLMATAGSFGPSTMVRPVAGPQVLSVLAMSSHHPVITACAGERLTVRESRIIRVVEPELIRIESLRMGSRRMNLPPPRA